MSAQAILQFVLLALQALPQASADVAALTAQLKLFQSENRDPTQAEWDELNARLGGDLGGLDAASNQGT